MSLSVAGRVSMEKTRGRWALAVERELVQAALMDRIWRGWRWVSPWLLVLAVTGFRPVSTQEVEGQAVAIRGYDTVAYHTLGRAVRGSPLIFAEWRGARWYFSRAAHREAFLSDPARYAPKYGGFCAYCVGESKNTNSEGDPEIFVVHEGRLYLLASQEVLTTWKQDLARHVREADAVYERLLAEFEKEQVAEVAPKVE